MEFENSENSYPAELVDKDCLAELQTSSKVFRELNNNHVILESEWLKKMLICTQETSKRLDKYEQNMQRLQKSLETLQATQDRRMMSFLKLFDNLQTFVLHQFEQPRHLKTDEPRTTDEHAEKDSLLKHEQSSSNTQQQCSQAFADQSSKYVSSRKKKSRSFSDLTKDFSDSLSSFEENADLEFAFFSTNGSVASNRCHVLPVASESQAFSYVISQGVDSSKMISNASDSTTESDCTNKEPSRLADDKESERNSLQFSEKSSAFEQKCTRKRDALSNSSLTDLPSSCYVQPTAMTGRSASDGFYATDSYYYLNSKQPINRSGFEDICNQPSHAVASNKSNNIFSKLKSRISDKRRKSSSKPVHSSFILPLTEETERQKNVAMAVDDIAIFGSNEKHMSNDVSPGSQRVRKERYRKLSLNSTGDDCDSRRSTDASDISVNDRPLPSNGILYQNRPGGFAKTTDPRPLFSRNNLSPLPPSPVDDQLKGDNSLKSLGKKQTTPPLSSINAANSERSEWVPNILYQSVSQLSEEENVYSECNEPNAPLLGSIDEETDAPVEKSAILDEVTSEQAEIERLEKGEPPLQPKRPGFSAANRNYLDLNNEHGHGGTSPSRSPAGVPTSPFKVMTEEEILQVEADAKLQKRLVQEADLEKELAESKRITEENEMWLKGQTMNASDDSLKEDNQDAYHTAEDVRRNRSQSRVPPTPDMPPPPLPTTNVIAPPPPTLKYEDVQPKPTMKLNRDNDVVYRDVMGVVKSVFHSNQEIMNSKPDDIFLLVKNIGKALKDLCASLEQEMPSLHTNYHREIEMAQKTTNKDLAQIINQTKLVKKFFVTTQVNEYKKYLMAANQVLAMDAKSLLDVVDKARTYQFEQSLDGEKRSRSESSFSSHGEA